MTTEGTGFVASSAYKPRNLFAGSEMPHVTEGAIYDGTTGVATLALVAGTVLALKSDGTCVKVDKDVPGATAPYAVLAEDVTIVQNVDTAVSVYSTGEFNEDALIFGGDDTIEDHRTALRALGIYAKKVELVARPTS